MNGILVEYAKLTPAFNAQGVAFNALVAITSFNLIWFRWNGK